MIGLLTEALRREAYLELVIMASEQEGYLEQYVAASPEEKEAMQKQLIGTVCRQMTDLIQRMAPEAAEAVLEMTTTQIDPSSATSPLET